MSLKHLKQNFITKSTDRIIHQLHNEIQKIGLHRKNGRRFLS